MHLIELCFDPFYYPELQSKEHESMEESPVSKTQEDEEIDTYDDASEY